jgi:probable selenium-dependent hydroxylase accessory protein YqeC
MIDDHSGSQGSSTVKPGALRIQTIGDAALLDLFSARTGLISVVGAGGKKTVMYRLAAAHSGKVAITCTAHIEHFPKNLPAHIIVDEEDRLIEKVIAAAKHERVIAFAQPCDKRGRYAGLSFPALRHVMKEAGFDVCFIKADGSRGRQVKAPKEDEPVIPPDSQTVLPVLSAKCLGQPATERNVHRLDYFCALTGAMPGEPIKPSHIARLLASPNGSLKGAGDSKLIPVINAVDDPERLALAREVAQAALSMTRRFDQVVLTAMRQEHPVAEIISI